MHRGQVHHSMCHAEPSRVWLYLDACCYNVGHIPTCSMQHPEELLLCLQYNGCKWRGRVLRIEKAKHDYTLRAREEAAADQAAAQHAAERGAGEAVLPQAQGKLHLQHPRHKRKVNTLSHWDQWRLGTQGLGNAAVPGLAHSGGEGRLSLAVIGCCFVPQTSLVDLPALCLCMQVHRL